MKIRVKLKLLSSGAKNNLTQAFFLSKVYNSKNNFEIYHDEKEKMDFAKVEVYFENCPPSEIIEAITTDYVEILELKYKFEESEEEKISEQTVDAKISKQHRHKKTTNTNDDRYIHAINDLAKKSTSYDEFVDNIANYIDFGSKKEFFVQLIAAATKISDPSDICWKNIEKEFGSAYNESTKIICSKCIAKKFEGSIPILKLIKVIVRYDSFDFSNERRVKMTCMPDNSEFEKVLANIDKTHPISDRVRKILNEMGWKEEESKSSKICFAIVKSALEIPGEITWDSIFEIVDGFITFDHDIAKMSLSTLINTFASKNGSDKKVSTIEFLNELKAIIM